jgi:hypothetical protein
MEAEFVTPKADRDIRITMKESEAIAIKKYLGRISPLDVQRKCGCSDTERHYPEYFYEALDRIL